MMLIDASATTVIVLSMMAANGAPVLLRKGAPLDLGKHFIDGNRVLGNGKTIEGLILGFLAGLSLGTFLLHIVGHCVLAEVVAIAVLGGLMGDVAAAFVKRRLGLPRGYPFTPVDQLDFFVGGILAVNVAGYLLDPLVILGFIPIVFLMHRLTNIAAYKLGLKDVPW